jgi:hypothetical protein
MRKTVKDGEKGIRCNFTLRIDNLYFADDIALLNSFIKHFQENTEKFEQIAKRIGLKIVRP